jgi:hypothetical protein
LFRIYREFLFKAVDQAIYLGLFLIVKRFRYTDDKLDEFFDLRERARRFMAISGDPLVLTIRSSGYVELFRRLPYFKGLYFMGKFGHYSNTL